MPFRIERLIYISAAAMGSIAGMRMRGRHRL